MKADAALTNRGGGKAGMAQRVNGQLHYVCPDCQTAAPSAKSMRIHVEAKHAKFVPPGGNNDQSWDEWLDTVCKSEAPVATGAAAMTTNTNFVKPGTHEAKVKKATK
eukprot:TRINITY_DN1457_c0_g1_i2.p1 TRINITY_DN1457_c0_g1~~TRINITY_DN1457_c0_g1_i2.p1  ORF type:complete len:107 (+),score=22.28 TRINITY_DN1457_c0_g1_i2:579-899(+)